MNRPDVLRVESLNEYLVIDSWAFSHDYRKKSYSRIVKYEYC